MAKFGLSILGSTGSIGKQTLEVAKHLGYSVEALACGSDIETIASQIEEYKPKVAVVANAEKAKELKKDIQTRAAFLPEILYGDEGLAIAATMAGANVIVGAISGVAGLKPMLAAARAGKKIALANKESLVVGGQILTALADAHGSVIIPVDSEHSAIFQCLCGKTITGSGKSISAAGVEAKETLLTIRRLLLTASGGPFRGKTLDELKDVTPEMALNHPNWSMGPKVTVDSATMMNKGLEVIEARWLFGVPASRIQVLVHPESIVHSMVEFMDGITLAQMGVPDMREPIQNALTWPKRQRGKCPCLDFAKIGSLHFEEPDKVNFPCLQLAYDAIKVGGTLPAIMNGANEAAVSLFLEKRLRFTDIPKVISEAMEHIEVIDKPKIQDLLDANDAGYDFVKNAKEVM